jgi:multicomponent Na+:H+ antiporter subunit B
MKHPVRLTTFLIAAAGFIAFFAWASFGLNPFGHYPGPYGDIVNAISVPELHVTDMATAVNFDIRAFDTLGEEFMFFAAVAGTLLIMRHLREEHEEDQNGAEDYDVDPSDAVRMAGAIGCGALIVFGVYLVLHAQLTPGGGFQGGAVIGTAALLIYLSYGFGVYRRLSPKPWMELAHATGAGGYVAVGLAGMIGGAFLKNVLPHGSLHHLASGGTIPLISGLVGLEIAAGFAGIFFEFINQLHISRAATRSRRVSR